MIHLNWSGFCIAKYNTIAIAHITNNPNTEQPIAKFTGEIFDHFFTITGTG
jgi:hypothetical protein